MLSFQIKLSLILSILTVNTIDSYLFESANSNNHVPLKFYEFLKQTKPLKAYQRYSIYPVRRSTNYLTNGYSDEVKENLDDGSDKNDNINLYSSSAFVSSTPKYQHKQQQQRHHQKHQQESTRQPDTQFKHRQSMINVKTTGKNHLNKEFVNDFTNGDNIINKDIIFKEEKLRLYTDDDHQLDRKADDRFQNLKSESLNSVNEIEPKIKSNSKFSFLESRSTFGDIYFVAIVAGCSAAAIFGVIGAGYCFYKFQQHNRATADVDYPAYGVVGPVTKEQQGSNCVSPSGTDRKLAQSAQMYHYHHQKQQMITSDKAVTSRHTSASDVDSDEENEEGDYTVYECPGLASTGEMEVKNPLFQDDLTPASSPQVNGVTKENNKN